MSYEEDRAVYHRAIRDLHRDAGLPSSRTIREATRAQGSRISHSTINNILNDRQVPRWNTLAPVIQALGGDGDHFMELWKAVAESPGCISLLGSKGTNSRILEELTKIRELLEAQAKD
jgi:hypothetical protein